MAGVPVSIRYCFGTAPPARSPRPPATITAATMPIQKAPFRTAAALAHVQAICEWAFAPIACLRPRGRIAVIHILEYCTAALARHRVLAKLYAIVETAYFVCTCRSDLSYSA